MPAAAASLPVARDDRHDAFVAFVLLAGAVVLLTLHPLRFVEDADAYLRGLRGLVRHPADAMTPLHMLPAAALTLLGCRAAPLARPLRIGLGIAGWLLLLELIQPIVQYRHARAGDLLAQWLGVWLGLHAAGRARRWRSLPWRAVWLGALLTCAAAVLSIGLRAQVGHRIGPLDPSYRITIGSEVGDERPWLGVIHHAALYADAATPAQASQLANTPPDVATAFVRRALPGAVLYDFVNTGATVGGVVQVPAVIGEAPTLFRRGAVLTSDGLDTSAGPPVASRENLGEFCRAAEQAGAVSIEASVTPARAEQVGPARILTISNGVGVRNLTLAQAGDAVEVRVRTRRTGLNASRVTATFPGVFREGRRVHLLAVSTGDRVSLFVNGMPAGERVLLVGPGEWLGFVPAWGDLVGAVALFLPIGVAAAGVIRRPVAGALLGAGVAGGAAGVVLVASAALGRPASLPLMLMACSIAVLGAVLASPRPTAAHS
ncbi:MAG: hypothetical protein ACTS22_09075 [Phycisphaerales bacterium]